MCVLRFRARFPETALQHHTKTTGEFVQFRTYIPSTNGSAIADSQQYNLDRIASNHLSQQDFSLL